jgi:5-methyltetrahydrofolate corrinoid/iron sulfur protein methyltransferase
MGSLAFPDDRGRESGLNRTFLIMCMAHGLDSAILDPLDEELMDSIMTAELLMNKFIYADSNLGASRKKG